MFGHLDVKTFNTQSTLYAELKRIKKRKKYSFG